eukprot:ANDGO_02840.mRNA.1 FACT complex subunit POB3
MANLQYRATLLSAGGRMPEGLLSLFDDRIQWDSKKKDNQVAVFKQDLRSVTWSRSSLLYEIGCRIKAGGIVRFQGLLEKDRENISSWIREKFNVQVENVELSVTGRNWGTVSIPGTEIVVTGSDEKLLLSVPLGEISGAIVQGKSEVSLEFNKPGSKNGLSKEAFNASDHVLSEIRFNIPLAAKVSLKDGEDPAEGPDEFQRVVVDRAEIVDNKDIICSFDDVKFHHPRSNFKIDFGKGFMRLIGKSHSHRVDFEMIQKMFCIGPDEEDAKAMYFVMVIQPPLRQGKSAYNILVAEFDRDDMFNETSPFPLNITEDEIKREYPDSRLQENMVGALWEVFVSVIKGLSKHKVIGSGSFQDYAKTTCVACAHKHDRGFLFPLDRSILFVPKPQFAYHKEISLIKIQRVGRSSFDITFILDKRASLQFSQISPELKDALVKFFREKQVEVEDAVAQAGDEAAVEDFDLGEEEDDDDEEDDEDFAGSADEDSDKGEAEQPDDEDADAEEEKAPKKKPTSKPREEKTKAPAKMVSGSKSAKEEFSRKRPEPESSSSKSKKPVKTLRPAEDEEEDDDDDDDFEGSNADTDEEVVDDNSGDEEILRQAEEEPVPRKRARK